jgi:hypothetical protein
MNKMYIFKTYIKHIYKIFKTYFNIYLKCTYLHIFLNLCTVSILEYHVDFIVFHSEKIIIYFTKKKTTVLCFCFINTLISISDIHVLL